MSLLTLVALFVATAPVAAQQSEVDRLADAYWQAQLDRNPEIATTNGFPGERNGRLTDLRPAAFDTYQRDLRELLRGAATIDPASLDRGGRMNLALLQEFLTRDLSTATCRRQLWEVNQQSGPQVSLLDLANLQPVSTDEDRRLVVARWSAMGSYFDQQVANLRTGMDSGLVAPRINVERVVAQLDNLLAVAPDSSPFLAPARRVPAAGAKRELTRALLPLVRDSILPAVARYRDFLRTELLPRSRAQPGLGALPEGAACYRVLIRAHTSLDLGADEIHQIGLSAVQSIRQEMAAVVRQRFHTENLDSVLAALRTDPAMAFTTRDQVFQAAVQATARMERKLPDLFGHLPVRRVVVERMPAYQEVDAPSAYYFPGAADNSRPGRYLVNTYHPSARPRFTAEVLAFHEAVPGHHLQIALTQELPLPAFRRYGGGVTAYVEGWALYTERLADEAGVYRDDLSRLGMLTFQSWRASRLVVDTGIHAMGWSREEAVDFMLANVALSRLDIESEVDRYIADPGQALGYMIGQREILRLRDSARETLGARFNLRHFHDMVLRDGPVTRSILQQNVDEWVRGELERP